MNSQNVLKVGHVLKFQGDGKYAQNIAEETS
jgi:hypothetical protein